MPAASRSALHSSQRRSQTKAASAITRPPSSGESSSRARIPAFSFVGSSGTERHFYIAFQLVPHRFVLHRGAVRPGVIVQVFLVVYKQRGVRVEGPLETT